MNAVAIVASEDDISNPDNLPSSRSEVSNRVEVVFRHSGYLDLRRLRCEDDDGIVTIKGRVGSYFLKQMAQVLAARVEGVTRVNNQLRVA